MRLTLSDGRGIANPTREGIEEALRSLDGDPGSFALMEDETGQTPDLFIQGTRAITAPHHPYPLDIGGDPDNFTVEYAEAIAEYEDEIEARHFRSRQLVRMETLVAMFQSYALADGAWKRTVAWEDTSSETEEYDDDDFDDPEDERQSPTGDPWTRKSGCFSLLVLFAATAVGATLMLGVL